MNLYKIATTALFTSLTIIGAFIKIPIPFSPIPITLQIIFVVLSGALLGSRYGALSQLLYIFIGLLGFPVFSQGGGFYYIFNPSFGYLIGFVLGSYAIGKIIEVSKNKNLLTFIMSGLSCILIIYISGIIHILLVFKFILLTPVSIYNAIIIGAVPFILKDTIMVLFTSIIAQKVFKQINNLKFK